MDLWKKRVETFEKNQTVPWKFSEVSWGGIWDIINSPYEEVNARLNQLKDEMIENHEKQRKLKEAAMVQAKKNKHSLNDNQEEEKNIRVTHSITITQLTRL